MVGGEAQARVWCVRRGRASTQRHAGASLAALSWLLPLTVVLVAESRVRAVNAAAGLAWCQRRRVPHDTKVGTAQPAWSGEGQGWVWAEERWAVPSVGVQGRLQPSPQHPTLCLPVVPLLRCNGGVPSGRVAWLEGAEHRVDLLGVVLLCGCRAVQRR